MLKRIAFFTYGTVAYLIFLGTFLYAVGFIGNIAVPTRLDGPAAGSWLAALVTDALLQREVVHLHVFDGLTFREIAEASGASINTVAARYRYALAKLRVLLDGVSPDHAQQRS